MFENVKLAIENLIDNDGKLASFKSIPNSSRLECKKIHPIWNQNDFPTWSPFEEKLNKIKSLLLLISRGKAKRFTHDIWKFLQIHSPKGSCNFQRIVRYHSQCKPWMHSHWYDKLYKHDMKSLNFLFSLQIYSDMIANFSCCIWSC